MSFFLEILRCILCCGEEDDRRYYRSPKSDISREYTHHETMLKGSSYSLSSSYDTLGVKRRTNRDDWNSGTVNSIAYGYGSVKTSPVNRPRVTETPLRLPLNPSPPKVTQKLTCMPLLPSPPSVQQNKLVDSAVNGKRTITAEQETSKCSQANGNRGTNNLATAPPVAVFSNNGLVKNPLLSSNKAVICSYGSVNSPVIPPTVNSNSFGSVKKSPVNPPTVAQTPLRLPPTPLPPKVTLKPICLSPFPSPLSVHRKNPVDSTVNEKSTITAEQETIKSKPAKGNEGSRTGNIAPTSSASFSQHSSEAFLSSNKPVICSSGPLQSASKPLLYSSGPLSSASKATAASLKASPSSQGPQPSASGPTLSLPPSPVQNSSIPVFAENIEYLISTGSRPSSSEWVRSSKSGLVPSPSPDASNLAKEKKWDQVQRGKTPTYAKTEDSKNLVHPPFSPDSLPTANNSPKSTPKLPPFPYELPSASKGTRSPTPCPLDKTNPAKKTKLVWVQKDTTPISSTNKVIKNWITLPQSFPSDSDSDSDSPPSSPILSPSSNGTSPFSSMPSPAPFGPANPPKRNTYFLHEGATLIYEIPEDIKNLIKRDIVPVVLKEPLSPLSYKDYFATLLYAEDFYVEKWSKFCLKNVTLELEEASVYIKSKKKSLNDSDEKGERLFVVFEINLIPERRPFLLSRDFVFLRPAGKKVEPFKGILHQVVKRNRALSAFDDYHVMKRDIVLAEFDDDFHLQHSPDFKYDVSFSFNRFCLKRSHQAIAAATELLFQNFLFPVQMYRTSNFVPPFISSHQNLDWDQISAVQQILMLRDSPPYLIDGPLSLTGYEDLSRTGLVIREAVLQIYKSSPGCRILVSAPTNKTCDRLVESLDDEIPELDMFRANAAFREIDVVPGDVLPLCQYEGECFTCPPLEKLKNFKVIFSTYVSSFRLHNEGLPAGHFSHIFLVDASSAMEPEALVVLTNLVDENTNVVVTGASGNSSKWVRSDIARWNGLKKSYFQRLLESKPYCNQDSMFVTNLWA